MMSLAEIGRQSGVVELPLKVAPGGMRRIDLEALADHLGVDDPSRIIFQQARGEALIRVYPTNPLADLIPATVDDLVMRGGRIVCGRYYDGSACRMRLFDPKTGNAQRLVIFGTTGAGKSRALQLVLAACKRNGVVVHLADLKEGQSVPEATGNVATRVTTQEDAILLLRALVAEAHDRMRRYAAMGRSGFIVGKPDRLMYGVVDEANRLLEKGAPHRSEAASLIKELGRTGRSVGVGIILAAQAGHLEELGGSDTLRAMLKEGEVILLRWSSGMMQQLVSDGLLPAGVHLQTIPKVIGRVRRIYRYDEAPDEGDEDPNTQGMAYHLTSARPDAMMRFSMVGSLAPCDGFVPLILDLYGPGDAPGVPLDLDAFRDPEPDEDDPEADGRPRRAVKVATAATAAPMLRLEDRIIRALRGGPLATYDVVEAVNRDGGKSVRLGSVRNSLTDLKVAGRVTGADGLNALT